MNSGTCKPKENTASQNHLTLDIHIQEIEERIEVNNITGSDVPSSMAHLQILQVIGQSQCLLYSKT